MCTITYIYRHIHIHITNARIHTYISIHRCTRAHDYAHVHAIVKMQLKIVMTHAHKCACEQPHAHRHACPRHPYMHTDMCMLSVSHMHAFSSHVTVKDLSPSYN